MADLVYHRLNAWCSVLGAGGMGILAAEALEEQSTNKFSFILTQKCQSIVLMQLHPKLPVQTRMAMEKESFSDDLVDSEIL